MLIPVDELRARLIAGESEALIYEVLLADGAAHVSNENIAYIKSTIAAKYNIVADDLKLYITGSAKLGYSLVEKKVNRQVLPRYRTFSADSDIDVTVISEVLFSRIWTELTKRAHRVAILPWDSGRLGDYMVYGWLRPDHFPNDVRVRSCDDWWDLFRQLSADARFQRRKVRGGLFYSIEQLSMYLRRSLNDCAQAEELSR